jgi:two-component system response regulator HydG
LDQTPDGSNDWRRSGTHSDLESRAPHEKAQVRGEENLLIGVSPEIEKVCRMIAKLACSTVPVLILGESGSGKERVARAIHKSGPNASKPFVPVDCRSLVPELVTSELFGHARGAFAGAQVAKEGLLSAAGGGTVFIDEIGELPLDAQARLLRALQEKEVRPMGATYAMPISARVLAATDRDLNEMVQRGHFRKDLYLRLNVVNVRIPPLRDRRMDIPPLADYFLDGIKRETNTARTLSPEAVRLLIDYDWPGNMRELENAICGAVALSHETVLDIADFPTQLHSLNARSSNAEATTKPKSKEETIMPIIEMEKSAILGAIERLHGDKLLAAKLLGIGKTTLYRKLKEYGTAEDSYGISIAGQLTNPITTLALPPA